MCIEIYLVVIQIYNMQKFNHCMDDLFLRLNCRKKIHTEQPESSIFPEINIGQLRKMKKKVRKTQRVQQNKTFFYSLDQIDSKTRKILKSLLLYNLKILKNSKSGSNLLPGNFITQISENVKSLPYFGMQYEIIIEKILDIFKQVMGVQYKDVLIARGQISGYYYVYFQNCFQTPYSLCCHYPVYLRIEQDKQSSLRQDTIDSVQSLSMMNSMKTQFICRKCNKYILQLYGKINYQCNLHHISPIKFKDEMKKQQQRRKLSIGVMIGSGKHKSYRISSKQSQNYSVIHRKVSPESIFIENSYRDKLKSLRIQSTRQTAILSQPRSNSNDLYPLSHQ